MTLITITPKNKKELLALKNFIKEHNLTFNETTVETVAKQEKTAFEKKLENSYSLEEFSEKTTAFLEGLTWKK